MRIIHVKAFLIWKTQLVIVTMSTLVLLVFRLVVHCKSWCNCEEKTIPGNIFETICYATNQVEKSLTARQDCRIQCWYSIQCYERFIMRLNIWSKLLVSCVMLSLSTWSGLSNFYYMHSSLTWPTMLNNFKLENNDAYEIRGNSI